MHPTTLFARQAPSPFAKGGPGHNHPSEPREHTKRADFKTHMIINLANLNPTQLVRAIQEALQHALESLTGKPHKGMLDQYNLHSARFVTRVADSFAILQEFGRPDMTKLLMRPVIEVTFRVEAIRRNPELLYQIAYSEILEDKKWFRFIDEQNGKPYEEGSEQQELEEVTRKYQEHFPEQSIVKSKLSTFDVARAARLEPYYNSHYRLYCQYSHASFRALTGNLVEITDRADHRVMSFCGVVGLNVLHSMGAETPDLQPLFEHLNSPPEFRATRERA